MEQLLSPEQREAEMLSDLAELAKDGQRMLILVGKVKTLRQVPGKSDTDPGRIYSDIVSGEGDTMNVEFIPNGHRPHVGLCGAFVLTPRLFQGKIGGFTVTSWA